MTCPSSSGLSFSSAISSSVWLSSSSGVEGWGLLPTIKTKGDVLKDQHHSRSSNDLCIRTCAEVSTRAAGVSLQQHALWRHLGPESSLNVINKVLAVGAVHPDSFPQWVLNVHLKLTFKRLTNGSFNLAERSIWFCRSVLWQRFPASSHPLRRPPWADCRQEQTQGYCLWL